MTGESEVQPSPVKGMSDQVEHGNPADTTVCQIHISPPRRFISYPTSY